jgi:hypothetical protein
MADVNEITKAIGAHGRWKERLREAIDNGHSEFTVEDLRSDHRCDFGKWLYSLSPVEQQSSHWQTVKDLHITFHREAAHVLDLALKGERQKAENAFQLGSDFLNASASLTRAMMKWKGELS